MPPRLAPTLMRRMCHELGSSVLRLPRLPGSRVDAGANGHAAASGAPATRRYGGAGSFRPHVPAALSGRDAGRHAASPTAGAAEHARAATGRHAHGHASASFHGTRPDASWAGSHGASSRPATPWAGRRLTATNGLADIGRL